jgi:cystinosin
MGYAKAAISFVKYVPQVYLNYSRKSTVGWSLANVILDFTGGSLSFLQIWINAVALGEPVFTGDAFNVVKFALSIMSILFDSIFMFQHYVLYRDSWNKPLEQSEAQESPAGKNEGSNVKQVEDEETI